MKKIRADVLLVEQGAAETRTKAQALILAGKVYTGEKRVNKAGEVLAQETTLSVRGELHPYVSRGGLKLAGALDAFDLDPKGMVIADFGASTGGFSDCLLQRGAAKIFALDVGYGQLASKLRDDPRVVVREKTNVRHLKGDELGELMDLVVIDVAFIGLDKVLPAAKKVLKPQGQILALVKPQFEVGREQVAKGGVVRDDALREQAIERVAEAAQALDFEVLGRVDSPIRGPKGNQETFLWLGMA